MDATPSPKHRFLTSKFQVGSSKSDRLTYLLSQKVFHSGDVPKDASDARRLVQKTKRPNILETEPKAWSSSTLVGQKAEKGPTRDLKRQLLKVRAGLMDEYFIKPSKFHSDEAILEKQKFVVAMTGKGPVGKFSGGWFNAVDERGVSSHCIREDWPDWNASHSGHTPEDMKAAGAVFQKKEARRVRMQAKELHLDKESYVNPTDSVTNINDRLRERKIDFQELKMEFKQQLKAEFPEASEERLQAMSQRLLHEKLLADEKTARFPAEHESFCPNIGLTTQDRRYKVYSHPGTWAWHAAENRYAWSCCLNYGQDSKGCQHVVKNPDAWCTLGFGRGVAVAATGKA